MSAPSQTRPLALALLVVGLLGTVAPYAAKALDLEVNTRSIVEVVDHVVPGVVILAVAAFTLLTGKLNLPAALLATLAGFWMSATHVPLLFQVGDDHQVELGAALFHSLPGFTVFLLAIALSVLAWRAEGEEAATG